MFFKGVELAKELLDQREIKPGFKISVDRVYLINFDWLIV